MITSKLKAHLARAAKPAIFAAALGMAAAASAEVIGPGMLIHVNDGLGRSAIYTYEVVQGPDGNWSFASNEPWTMYATDGTALAILNPVEDTEGQCSATYIADPVVNLSFSVQAGSMSPTTTFMIGSALLAFPTINGAIGRASAGYSVTDTEGDAAILDGIGDPAGAQGAYLAQYNGFAGTVSGTTFCEFFPLITALPDQTAAPSQNEPAVGFNAIVPPVSDMSSFVSFTLTRNDLASGTTNFEIIPEPASLALLLVGAALLRRRN